MARSIIGLLSNRGAAPATHVKVAAALYDLEHQVVGVLWPYLVPRGALAPGDALPFELKFYALGGAVSSYRVEVQTRMPAPMGTEEGHGVTEGMLKAEIDRRVLRRSTGGI